MFALVYCIKTSQLLIHVGPISNKRLQKPYRHMYVEMGNGNECFVSIPIPP